MLLGLDVGGTNVDVVLFENGELVKKAKVPTQTDNLLESILEGLSLVLHKIELQKVERLVLSTTLGTNAIIQKKTDQVGIIVVSGPGIDPEEFAIGDYYFPISGYVDHRGREVHPLKTNQILSIADELEKDGIRQLAIVGKFSVRNPSQELTIKKLIGERFDYVSLGHQISGKLSFPRRIATAYLNSAIEPIHRAFFQSIQQSLKEKGLQLMPFLLKADGGTMTLERSMIHPVQNILSGPAASIMGALIDPPDAPVTAVLDIGGTTTDMAILIDQVPLFEPVGINIDDYKTLVRALKTQSIGIGGDSSVRVENKNITIGPERLGPAMAFGGNHPTPTDALVVLGKTENGNKERAYAGMKSLGEKIGKDPLETARHVLSLTCSTILNALDRMVSEINKKPVYTVRELLTGYTVKPGKILVIGGPAPYFADELQRLSGLPSAVATNWEVANAIGAACARTTCAITLFADTEQKNLFVPEEDIQQRVPRTFGKEDAIQEAFEILRQRARKFGCYEKDMDMEVIEQHEFNMVRGFYTSGQNIRIQVQVKPGIVTSQGTET